MSYETAITLVKYEVRNFSFKTELYKTYVKQVNLTH